MNAPLISIRTTAIIALSVAVGGSAGLLSLVAEATLAQAACCATGVSALAVAFFHRVVEMEAGKHDKSRGSCRCG